MAVVFSAFAVYYWGLPPIFLSKATVSDNLSPFLKKLIELTALKMLSGSSDAHPNIMNYERRAANSSLKISEQ